MENHIIVSYATNEEKAQFYKKTYLHVALAILAFVGVEGILMKTVPLEIIAWMFSGKYIWLFIIGLVWLGSFVSQKLAFDLSREKQYVGLGFYVLLQAIIFLPMLTIASMTNGGAEIVMQAAIITLFMFSGLTAVVFTTRTDFSFLRTAIMVGGTVALGAILAGALFGFNLGLWFSVGMVVLACASILYQTDQIKNSYGTQQYVGAALQLFSSVMLLFWYILRILMSRRS